MEDTENPSGAIHEAVTLMRAALRSLDAARTNLNGADAHLQMAIDAASGVAPLGEGASIEDEAASLNLLTVDKTVVRAMGGALALFATLLSRQGLVTSAEVGELLGIFAVVTGEEDRTEGLILGCWAAMIRDLAARQS